MPKVSGQTLIFDWSDIDIRLSDLLWKFNPLPGERATYIYGVPHGGSIVAGLFYIRSGGIIQPSNTPEGARFIVDDIISTGRTKEAFYQSYPRKEFVTLVDKKGEGLQEFWVHLPWERPDEPAGARQSSDKVIGALPVPTGGH